MKQTPLSEIFRPVCILLIAAILVTISGCAGILLGGAATSAVVANDPRTTGTFVEDQAIEVKAYSALRANPDIKEQTHIGITSYNQVVLLTGQAPTEDLRSQVVEIVSAIAKVRHIHNEVNIAAPNSMMSRTNDGVLTTKVKTKMLATAELNATKIKVVSEAGVVYLMGLVSAAEGNLAAEIASRTGGVQRVVKLFEAQ
ncbi:MAG: BON domain-containing protein [Pseudomonadota bacterium]|nr:BON domain-containing protein [Pseudomonadota bacterium]